MNTPQLLEQAIGLHQAGQLPQAEQLYRQILASEPTHAPAHFLLGMACLQQGRNDEATTAFDRATLLDPANADAHANRAIALAGIGRLAEAVASLDRAVALKPSAADFHSNRAQLLRQLGRAADALAGYDQALKLAPEHVNALTGRGGIQREMGRPRHALADYEKALSLHPNQAAFLYNCGMALSDLGRAKDALEKFDSALALNPDFAAAWNNRGCALKSLNRPVEALAAFDRALALEPGLADAFHNKGTLFAEQENFAQAVGCYDKALAVRPDFLQARNDRGVALRGLRQYTEALASFDQALATHPGFASAHNNRGILLWDMGRINEAGIAFDAAVAADPGAASAFYNRGSMIWAKQHLYEPAVRDIAAALALDPDFPFARGSLLHLKMYACDWTDFAEDKARLDADIQAGKQACEPFAYLALSGNPADLQRCAQIYAAAKFPARPARNIGSARRPGKIRLGYVSGEFRQQATAFLTAGLYEHHDKTRFELVAFDNGGTDGSPLRARLENAFDRFVDISDLSAEDAARRIQAEDIDILVNLNGYFGKMRMDVFAQRPAPLQVNYLGFPGTLGAAYIDYILADRHVIPPGEDRFYAEQVVRLPHSYQATDNKRGAVAAKPERAAHGLPQNAFVFCHFNQSYKLTPESFAGWMRILKEVDGSVLWLLQDNEAMPTNLKREAATHGIDPARLIFAPILEQEPHLARLALGDLYLDSQPYGAHTTASDALWAGLPLVTQTGTSFAGRVATSLLHAIGLPELVTASGAEFEALAVTLATNPARLAAIRQSLGENRGTAPLFDTEAFTRGIEKAYETMFEIHQKDELARGFWVEI